MASSRKKKNHEEHENHERWLVSYADFITLLFAFFVVMYATSSQNLDKEKQFEESIRAEFKLGGMNMSGAPGVTAGSGSSGNSYIEQPIPQQRRENLNVEIANAIKKKVQEDFNEEEAKKIIVSINGQGVRIILSADEVYEAKSAKIRVDNIKFINRVVNIFKESIYPIVIENHADEADMDNWELTTQRSSQFVRYLIKVHNLPVQNISAVGFANQKPMAHNPNEKAGHLNNRLEILIISREEE